MFHQKYLPKQDKHWQLSLLF